jgi:hypothetical protein
LRFHSRALIKSDFQVSLSRGPIGSLAGPVVPLNHLAVPPPAGRSLITSKLVSVLNSVAVSSTGFTARMSQLSSDPWLPAPSVTHVVEPLMLTSQY